MTEQASAQDQTGHPLAALAAVVAVCGIISLPIVEIATMHRPPALPQNKLECATSGSGYASIYDPLQTPGQVTFTVKNLHVRSVRTCTWEWPSEYLAGQGTSYYQNPPTVIVTWAGKTMYFSGNSELYVTRTPLNINS